MSQGSRQTTRRSLMRNVAPTLTPKRAALLAETLAFAGAPEATIAACAKRSPKRAQARRKDRDAESRPAKNRRVVPRRRAHRRPYEAMQGADTAGGRLERREDCRAHAVGQHRDGLRPKHENRANRRRYDLTEDARPARSNRQNEAHRQHDAEAGSHEASGKQGGIEREPMRAAPERGHVGERRQHRAQPTRRRRSRSTRRARQAGSASRRARRGSARGPSARTACGSGRSGTGRRSKE